MRTWFLVSWLVIAVAACNGSTNDGGGTGGTTPAGGTGGTGGGTGGGGTGAPSAGATDPAITMIQAQIDAAKIDRTQAGWRTSLPRPRLVHFTPGRSYTRP